MEEIPLKELRSLVSGQPSSPQAAGGGSAAVGLQIGEIGLDLWGVPFPLEMYCVFEEMGCERRFPSPLSTPLLPNTPDFIEDFPLKRIRRGGPFLNQDC
jgi:hypothetical protein